MKIESNTQLNTVSINNPAQAEQATVVLQKDKEFIASTKAHEKTVAEKNKETKPTSIEVSREKIQDAVGKLQDYADQYKRQLRFSIDDDTGRTVVRLLDSEDNVLRQIPSEEVLELAKSIEKNIGLIFTEQV